MDNANNEMNFDFNPQEDADVTLDLEATEAPAENADENFSFEMEDNDFAAPTTELEIVEEDGFDTLSQQEKEKFASCFPDWDLEPPQA